MALKQNTGVFYGLIAAVSLTLFTTVLYLTGIDAYLSNIAYLGYVLLIGLAIAAVIAQRKANGGWLEFKEALKTAFTVFVLALAAQTLFIWILLNFIDPHFKELLAPASLVRDARVLKWFRMPDDEIAQTIAAERGKDRFTLSAMSLGLAFSCIVHFIIAVLIAAFTKKKKNA
jgi:hypothetical protein